MSKIKFNQAQFYITVNDFNALPETSVKEIAICGRSNAGKSSLLNTLTNQNRLAFTSKTPGRTQHINYFSIGADGLFIVDLPGYGYAKVPEEIRKHWGVLLSQYLQQRQQIVGLVLIMDIRHPLKPSDYTMLDFFNVTNKPIHIVLSKADKLSQQQKIMTLKEVKQELEAKGYQNCTVQIFSAPKRLGVTELEQQLTQWIDINEI
jgi:GTP-binding protein